jgi:TonB family protein
MSRVASLLLLVASASFAHASDVADLARLAPSRGEVVAPLTAGLKAPEPLARATAARVVAVRGEKALVPALREALATEADPDAAREEIRALVLTSTTDDDVDFAAKAAAKFGPRMDGALADSIARLGARGLALYPTYVKPLRRIGDESNFFRIALWQSKEAATETAVKLLESDDERGWCTLLDGVGDASLIDAAAFSKALGASSAEMRQSTMHCLLAHYDGDRAHFPASLKDVVTAAAPEDASPNERFSRELLGRLAGADVHESDVAALLHGNCEHAALFTSAERAAANCLASDAAPNDPRRAAPVMPAQLVISGYLPPGLTQAVIRDAGCREPAVGLASVSIDRAGRVTRLEASHVQTPPKCLSAIATLIGLSLFEPQTVTSNATEEQLVIAKPPKDVPCLDATSLSAEVGDMVRSATSGIVAPSPSHRVDPILPQDARASLKDDDPRDFYMVVDSTIAPSGCIRGMRIIKQSPYGAFNAAALAALSQWKFHPATDDGTPVAATTNVTVHFKLR